MAVHNRLGFLWKNPGGRNNELNRFMNKNPYWKLLAKHFLGFSLCAPSADEGVFMKAKDNFIAHNTESLKSEQTYILSVYPSVLAMLGNLPKHFGWCRGISLRFYRLNCQ